MSVSNLGALEWANPLAALSLSDRENAARKAKAGDTFVDLKRSLHALFVRATGVQGDVKVEFFGLRRPDQPTDLVFFVPEIRLDLANHTMVLDAFAMPLHQEILPKVVPKLTPMQVCWVDVDDTELVTWKALLPSFVERCRTWEHTSSCEYRVPGATVPLATEFTKLPICTCGRGQVTEAFRKRKEWAPFAPYVTRAAIGMLFPVSYLEPVGFDPQRRDADPPSEKALRSQVGDRCFECQKWLPKEKRLHCSKCKKAAYCDRQCQMKDWQSHRKACKKVST